MAVRIGTSGWQYRDWREAFYPSRLPVARWLEHYAARFAAVEVNNSFYRLPPPETFAAWAERTPDDFVVAPKVSRYLTHFRRLREPAEPVARFLASVAPLGPKLGPLLVQLPPDLAADVGLLRAALERFPAGVRVAVEFRHPSWDGDAVDQVLADHDAARCLADRGSRPVGPLVRTAGWGYLRLHEGRGSPRPCYGRTALGAWARRLAGLFGPADEVYAFFNNDPRCCAVSDARRFALACRAAGLATTRVPAGSEVAVRR